MSLTLQVAHEVLLRAGGGQGFGGGGGGFGGGGGGFSGGGYYGGGSSSSGSGDLGGGSLLLGLIFGGPGFVVLIIVLSMISRAMRGGARSIAYERPSYEGPSVTVADPSTGLAAIAAHDPAFDLNAFLSRVQRSFFIIQQAWSDCKPEMSRRVMADSLWDQHRIQIEQYVQKHQRNILDNLTVGNEQVVAASSDPSYDSITVRIAAACADYDVDTQTGKVTRGDKAVRTWAEDWQFQRSAKAVTRPDGGTMNDKCPNCGAPLSLDLTGTCTYCKAQVMAGEYDWVLVRISQV
jgi:hypothetical protein